jgi:Nif11 domain
MTTKSVPNFFAVVKENKSLQRRIQMATNLDTIIEIADGYDYQFTDAELQSFLEKMPNKDLAPAVNPGIGNRLHLNPR